MKTRAPVADPCMNFCRNGDRSPLCALESWFSSLGLDPALAARFASGWRVNRYTRGHVIFYQDNQPMALHFLCSGSIKLVRNDRAGRRQIIRIIQGPDTVGERALIAGEPYAASAEVMEDARICVIDAARFFELWNKSPELVRAVARRLASKLGESDMVAVELAMHTIQQRLAKLIILKTEAQRAPATAFLLTPSRKELAELLGSAPEVISRTLRELARRRLIALEDQHVRVLDLPRLRAAAGLPPQRLDFYQAANGRTSLPIKAPATKIVRTGDKRQERRA